MTVHYQRAKVHTSEDIRAIAERTDSHFFDRDTLRFFGSRLLAGAWALDGNDAVPGARFIFLTSERDGIHGTGREYKVRQATLGTVRDERPYVEFDTLGTFETPRGARKHAQWLATRPTCDNRDCNRVAGVDLFHGREEPAYACGHCAEYREGRVIAGHSHRVQTELLREKFGPVIAEMPLDATTRALLLEGS